MILCLKILKQFILQIISRQYLRHIAETLKQQKVAKQCNDWSAATHLRMMCVSPAQIAVQSNGRKWNVELLAVREIRESELEVSAGSDSIECRTYFRNFIVVDNGNLLTYFLTTMTVI